jgi:hypothetical protein
MSASRRALGLIACVVLFGCERKPVATSLGSTGLPPLDEHELAAAAKNDHPEHAPSAADPGHAAGELPPGHPGIDEQTTPADVPFDAQSVISGVLKLDEKVKAKVAAGDVIFMVARGAGEGGAPGPVLAVKKLTAGKWPLPFVLDGRDAMMTGTKLSGKVVISVRVDKDGDAISKNPGDVTGVSGAITPPASQVVITLDTVL